MSHSFNSDLFVGETDLETARGAFPRVFYALDDPALRAVFSVHDRRANLAKTRSRKWGVIAVSLATLALILAASSDLYVGYGHLFIRAVAAIGALAGIASMAIAVLGVMYRTRKIRWLTDRLATERLRQFHFQQYAAHCGEIIKGAGDLEAAQDYVAKRGREFDKLKADFLSRLEAEFQSIVEANDPGEGEYFAQSTHPIPDRPEALQEYFNAYETLRFRRQIDYCNLLLSEKRSIWKNAPASQAKVFAFVAMSLVMLILLFDAVIFLGAFADASWITNIYLQTAGMWAAFLALSVRTLEEGFQVESETARMRHYRHTVNRIYQRFKSGATPQAKLAAMRELERAAYDEMVNFLKSHNDAEFVM
jgi:hypothetical protein